MSISFDKNAILNGDVKEMHRLFAAAAEPAQLHSLYTASAEHLIKILLGSDQLDGAFIPIIENLKQQLIAEVSPNTHFYTDPLHPLRRLLDCLLQHGCYWSTHNAKSQHQFLQQYQRLVDEVTLRASVNSSGVENAFNIFNQWVEAKYKRATLLELRVCQAEANHLALMCIEYTVLDLINKSLAGKRLPTDAIRLITGSLKSELQHSLINYGDCPLFWYSWREMLPMLVSALEINANEADKQKSPHSITLVKRALKRSITLDASNPENYQYVVNNLNQVLSKVVKKQALDYTEYNALLYPNRYPYIGNQDAQQINNKIGSLQIGSWIIFQNDRGQKIRCKLALKHDDTGSWLFTDRGGRKVMIKSPADLSACFDAGTVRILTPKSFSNFFSKLLDTLIVKAKQQEKKQQQLADIASTPEPKETVKSLQQKSHEEDTKRIQKLEFAKNQIALLNVGASVEIYSAEQTMQSCKLAIIIATIGKYIFVDKLGRKIAEYQREQLIQAYSEGKLKFINNVDTFEDRLVQVIRSAR